MDNFTIIYKILKALEAAMDFEAFDVSKISHERLGISYERWEKMLISLDKRGYIDGIAYDQCFPGRNLMLAPPIQPIITLRGLEYLAEIEPDIKETIPEL